MDVAIRAAAPTDVASIRDVAKRAWKAAHEPIVGTDAMESFLSEYYDAESFQARIDCDETILDVAVEGGTVVGYILTSPNADDETTFDLSSIYVTPMRWGEGIGQQLLDHVERRVREHGGERIQLGVMAENDRAVRFYEAADYRQDGEFHDEHLGVPGYTYVKTV
ncbi:GNAT family N-acetyltransferase [Halogeometricum borinquense]|uniref:GNAT family N-acetyltransferase n=1 Tax=Halogeometricum borinquense TaxID=60847 RepID=A0A482TAT1_9EURY|nr:GNAT family N-acetyltransferase [Halogeometricum borinquense]RYJ14740.1 GNAT family N-acetyltransferase [Halogeometricum borinquense]